MLAACDTEYAWRTLETWYPLAKRPLGLTLATGITMLLSCDTQASMKFCILACL